jgi:NAD(P)-dependent dehydrogenase (short-subunit alcohol dehydrogenase family)
VVNVSSGAHRIGAIRFDDLHWERGYKKWPAYGQSKLANLLFTFELERRLSGRKAPAMSVACHPGYAATNLQFVGPRLQGSSLLESLMQFGNNLFAQSAEMGALPTVYAAAAPGVRGGEYIGPSSFGELWGHPKVVGCSAKARDPETARRLWEVSEELTGVRYPIS